MSDSDSTEGSTTAPELDPPTQEIFVDGPDGRRPAAPAAGVGGAAPWDEDDQDEEWPDRGPRQGLRMSVPTVALLALLIAAGGIWGGAALQRSEGTTSGSSASSLASLFRGARGATTGSPFAAAGAAGGATTGTVTEVSGDTLYVTNASGDLVKVTVGPSATVDRNAAASLGSLQVGDTVVVEGTKASSGSVTATSVSATAAGVTSPFSRLAAGG
jgi:hypothetical protein